MEFGPRQLDSPPPSDHDDEEMADEYDDEEGMLALQIPTFGKPPRLPTLANCKMLIGTTGARSPYQSSAQDMLRPLQDTADRVSKQAEEFAKALDKFVVNREPTDQSLWEDALLLLERFSKIAHNRRQKTAADDSEAQVQKIQLENDLWVLVRNLLACSSPETVNNAQIAQDSRLGGLHRYSSNAELWSAFLDSDAVAQEYECILSWLQERAAATSEPIEDLLRDLNEKSERGDGVWSAGPIYTQTAIKQQKRTRVWSKPLEPSNPGLNRTHVRNSDNKPLVTQLDPDSRTRESAVLQEQDEYHEEAAWQTCWEMLRRGQTAADIQSWWAERKEVWRYEVLRGCGANPTEMADSPWLRILNLATNPEWLARCKALAHNPAIVDRYQKAVYGILCGDNAAAKSAGKTIDDHLFALFNALLMDRYLHYIQVYRDKLSEAGAITYPPQPPSTEQIRHYTTKVHSNPAMKSQTHLAHKLFELTVVSKDYEAFFVNMGQAAAHVAHTTGQGDDLIESNKVHGNEISQVNAQDQDAVRMAVHLQLILRALGFLDSAYAQHEYEMENNIASYIGFLKSIGRYQLIPTYAAKLSATRAQHVLGTILINVTNSRERDTMVRLMKHEQLNVADVIYGIFSLANYADLQKLEKMTQCSPPTMTVPGGAAKFAVLRVRSSLMTGNVTDADERALRSVEWFRYIDAENWGSAAWAFGSLYKIFLADGNFVALRQLIDRVSLSEISLAAVGMNLNFADGEPPAQNDETDDEDMDEDRVNPISPSRKRRDPIAEHPLTRRGNDRETLAFKALIWRQLEQLTMAIDALDMFQETADNLEANRNNPSLLRTYKRDLKKALDDVRSTIVPLLDNDFLCQPQDEQEGVQLTAIRNHYIPECILAYNSALWFAGHFVSRAWLVECMELAQRVAETPMLTNAFVEGGRMKELVRAFAVDSEALLQATEQSGPKAKKMKTDKGNGDIWKVGWKEQDEIDLEAMD
ncbi:Nucleoporin nup84 [Exophiala xenobiotica]|uniref:Nuclear pore complex protein n=1 Tax=Vermiconidia calcicola TaxID=1690605 RepID=A0AAV9QDN6_9PEZI|nr:Nucleoporin nup84 [Exophiala xenobiotica]KAK5538503.1 Nucleoporin nup84 [Vermiconidia calcicola]KAK5548010.1 Nucleoporin nup84 [Chaetothyriales sp. CCFEE 6169]KAK5264135.1 Nucleoporin nup84 [Exophiala xenobiotica]KAK5305291.1 Nucleoporin nup84 [Exophiala xenobiotica]